mmetsp:Transcript_6821/g.10996  ORF Transcript_6821/g.10996 Transcript_6821/m.10996 type:complete len:201 (-) Transcript_6821:3841-4443(-)
MGSLIELRSTRYLMKYIAIFSIPNELSSLWFSFFIVLVFSSNNTKSDWLTLLPPIITVVLWWDFAVNSPSGSSAGSVAGSRSGVSIFGGCFFSRSMIVSSSSSSCMLVEVSTQLSVKYLKMRVTSYLILSLCLLLLFSHWSASSLYFRRSKEYFFTLLRTFTLAGSSSIWMRCKLSRRVRFRVNRRTSNSKTPRDSSGYL